MGPEHALPLPKAYKNESQYVDDLLDFVVSSETLQLLVGGVHILDFFTRSPDLYHWLLPQDWRLWFELHDLSDLLDFFLRQDLSLFAQPQPLWRGKSPPPASLVSYLEQIHRLSLRRDLQTLDGLAKKPAKSTIPHIVAVGMKQKKIHEVDNFARYIHKLTSDVEAHTGRQITHVVDFGSGQNYLGRTLASPPYNKHVVAVESRHANVEGAKAMDIHARLAPRTGTLRNKKEWRAQQRNIPFHSKHEDSSDSISPTSKTVDKPAAGGGSIQYVEHMLEDGNLESVIDEAIEKQFNTTDDQPSNSQPYRQNSQEEASPNLMVISLHSCGNLTHHGLRALTLNPSVAAVALVGCCYNLVTERLTAPSYKLPNLRPPPAPSEPTHTSTTHPDPTPATGDPHGYPMSARVATSGIALNITARMMAVQAPYNWTAADSAAFFRRHFYRALLQRVLVDRGVVEAPADASGLSPAALRDAYVGAADSNVVSDARRHERGGATQPVVVGSLRKACYVDFVAYVRGAVEKLGGSGRGEGQEIAGLVRELVAPMSDAEIGAYAESYAPREKDLSIVWSLMALSATLVEAVVVVDRWLWLQEQMGGVVQSGTDCQRQGSNASPRHQGPVGAEHTETDENDGVKVRHAWVESVFDYSWSPRNLVVVGVKR